MVLEIKCHSCLATVLNNIQDETDITATSVSLCETYKNGHSGIA